MADFDAKTGLEEVQKLLSNPVEFTDLVNTLYDDFDTDGNGKIDFSEGEALVKTINSDMATSGSHKNCKPLTPAQIKEIVVKFDENKDKILQKEEFEKLVRYMLELEVAEYKKDLGQK